MSKKPYLYLQNVCPQTGYRIFTCPEWTDVSFDENYETSLSIIDDRIIFSRPMGYATLSGVNQFLKLVDDIIEARFPAHVSCILVEDMSNLSGATTEARRRYIKWLKNFQRLKGLIFFGTSPLLKISVKLGKRFYRGPVQIEMAKTYESAVTLAQNFLSKAPIRDIDEPSPFSVRSFNPQRLDDDSDLKKDRDRKWGKRLDDFNIQFTALDSKVLYATVRGVLKTEHIQYIAALREKATKEINPQGVVDYTISDISQLTSANIKARKAYVQSLRNWSRTQQFKMFIFLGANRFMRTAIRLGRSFLPFKVCFANDLQDALTLIHQDRLQRSIPSKPIDPEILAPDQVSAQIKPYVNELLGYLGVINWELDGSVKPHDVEPSHLFFPIYEAVKLIKDELNDLFDEKNEAEKKLQEANSELESRVRERTADLERVNRELMLEIIERKQTLIELQQAKLTAEKANRAKSEFLANMSHELRTPLNHIIGFTEIVLDQHFGPLNEKQTEHLQDVTGSSQHLLSLINDILDLSKVEAGKLKLACTPIHLVQLLQDSLKMIQEKAYAQNITISLEASDAPTTIQADNRMFRQIIYNLLSNAVKFTPEGGHISINTYLHRIESSLVSPMVSKHHTSTFQAADNGFAEWFNKQNTPLVEIAVKDTGIGIRPNDLHRIFRAFEQADGSSSRLYQGTGLGLSLTQKLVELHGGRIWVESPGEGHGSVFRFFIPISQKTKS